MTMTEMNGCHRCNSRLTRRLWFLNKQIPVGNECRLNLFWLLMTSVSIKLRFTTKAFYCPVRVLLSVMPCCASLPVCPCSAAAFPLCSHICGGGSFCRLCSGGRALPCSLPGTPHAWRSYLKHPGKKRKKRFTFTSGAGLQSTLARTAIYSNEKGWRKWKILFRITSPVEQFSKCDTRYTLLRGPFRPDRL